VRGYDSVFLQAKASMQNKTVPTLKTRTTVKQTMLIGLVRHDEIERGIDVHHKKKMKLFLKVTQLCNYHLINDTSLSYALDYLPRRI